MHFSLESDFFNVIDFTQRWNFLCNGLLHLNIIIVIFIPVGWRQEREVAGGPQVPFWCHVINYLKHSRHMHNMDFIPKGFLAAFISSKGHSLCDTSAIIFFVDLCGLSCSSYLIYVFIFIWISHLLWDYFAIYHFMGDYSCCWYEDCFTFFTFWLCFSSHGKPI